LPDRDYISLIEVLSTVNRLTGFIDAFEPWYVKYARTRPPEKTFLAGILGYGCFIGIGKIARISKWINETERVCFFRNDTINSRFSVPFTALFSQPLFPPATSFKGARAEGISANLVW
jgi:hypothetical protein